MANWLDTANAVTRQERQTEYGSPLVNFLRTALLWSVYLDTVITPVQVAWMMASVKMAREMQSHKTDNYIDAIGYLACVQQMEEELHALGYTDGIRIFTSGTPPIGFMQRILREAEHGHE